MTIIGILAILASLINLYYSYYERVENFFWNLPSYGLIAVGMFMCGAYANAFMQISIAITSTYGYFIWTKNRKQKYRDALINMIWDRNHNDCSIIISSRLSLPGHLYSVFGVVIITFCIYYLLSFINDISPGIDALSFAMLFVATIQLNYKKIESWIYYILADCISVVLAYKGNDWYNIVALMIFIILNSICLYAWIRRYIWQQSNYDSATI